MDPKASRPVKACPSCGSTDLRWKSGGANSFLDALGGTGIGLSTCGSCGETVLPVEFKSEEARQKFAKKRGAAAVQKAPEPMGAPRINPARSYSLMEFGMAFVLVAAIGFAVLAQGTLTGGLARLETPAGIAGGAVMLVLAAACLWLFMRTLKK